MAEGTSENPHHTGGIVLLDDVALLCGGGELL